MKNNKNIFMYSGIMHSIENDSMEPLITKVPGSQLKTSKEPSRWYKVIEKDNKKELNIGVVVEDFRAGFYYSFIFMLGVGFILTKCFTDVDHTAIIKDVFGASNVCTYLYFPLYIRYTMSMGICNDVWNYLRSNVNIPSVDCQRRRKNVAEGINLVGGVTYLFHHLPNPDVIMFCCFS